MRVELSPELVPKRGAPVVIGNVYANNRPPAFKTFRIVVGINDKSSGRTVWNNIICVHVDGGGHIVGCSATPREYVKNHWDLVGIVTEMPTLKIEWLSPETKEENQHGSNEQH